MGVKSNHGYEKRMRAYGEGLCETERRRGPRMKWEEPQPGEPESREDKCLMVNTAEKIRTEKNLFDFAVRENRFPGIEGMEIILLHIGDERL